MGLLFWRRKEPAEKSKEVLAQGPKDSENGGAMEVARPKEATVFEFGSAASSEDGITLAGYCPVSNQLEPCRWEIVPSVDPEAPQFRIVF